MQPLQADSYDLQRCLKTVKNQTYKAGGPLIVKKSFSEVTKLRANSKAQFKIVRLNS